MTNRIYIGNLPYNSTEDGLKEHFSQVGEIKSVTIIKDRDTGRSKGFGFIEMENAQAAIDELDGKEFGGRQLRVNQAKERPAR